jgi:hypothetical protein
MANGSMHVYHRLLNYFHIDFKDLFAVFIGLLSSSNFFHCQGQFVFACTFVGNSNLNQEEENPAI